MIKPEQSMERVCLFEDSMEVAVGVSEAADTYWNKEAGVHIEGMWKLCKELSAHITMLQEEIVDLECELEDVRRKVSDND